MSSTESIAPPFTRGAASREERATLLFEAHGGRIERLEGNAYLVPSQDGERTYRVQYGKYEECECPDHEHRGSTCVHLIAVASSTPAGVGTGAAASLPKPSRGLTTS